MKNLFEFAEACLHNDAINEKLALTHQAWHAMQIGELSLVSDAAGITDCSGKVS